MAVAFDQGDNQGHGVHPRFKSVPARRLAMQLINTAFAGKEPFSGPLPVSAASRAVPSESTAGLLVTVALSHADGLRLNDTHTCNEQFRKLCCKAGDTAFGARICTAATAAGCAKDADKKTVFNANVTIGTTADSIVVSVAASEMDAAAAAGPATFVEFGLTDFPQCSVVNALDIALGPFILPVK